MIKKGCAVFELTWIVKRIREIGHTIIRNFFELFTVY